MFIATEHVAEIWTDVYFDTLAASKVAVGDYSGFHELDIAVTKPHIPNGDKPVPTQVHVACECKDTSFKKDFVRTVLGLRRELAYLGEPDHSGFFSAELGAVVRSNPPSRVFLFCSDPKAVNYTQAPAYFDITIEHL
ncbi:MAG: hypothetical protein ACKO1J_12595 [Tagaea sp.]